MIFFLVRQQSAVSSPVGDLEELDYQTNMLT